jgi:hypothetical protein
MLCKGCGKMAMDNSCARLTGEESEHPPLTSCSQKTSLLMNRKSGQLMCYKTGQFYLLLTIPFVFLAALNLLCYIYRQIFKMKGESANEAAYQKQRLMDRKDRLGAPEVSRG